MIEFSIADAERCVSASWPPTDQDIERRLPLTGNSKRLAAACTTRAEVFRHINSPSNVA
jgi:hypothetical protein